MDSDRNVEEAESRKQDDGITEDDWEPGTKLFFGKEFWTVLKGVLFTPTEFFSKLKTVKKCKSVILFAMACILLRFLGQLIWPMLLPDPYIMFIKARVGEGTFSDPTWFERSGVLLRMRQGELGFIEFIIGRTSGILVFLISQSVILFLSIKRFCDCAEAKEFRTVFQIVMFSTATQLVYILPAFTSALYPLINVVITAIAIKEVYRVKIETAVLCMVVMCAGLALLEYAVTLIPNIPVLREFRAGVLLMI